ncbi:MAG: hypothetical protein ACI8YQ_001084 [Polaribacter sp.]|jgi:hypothetical protein
MEIQKKWFNRIEKEHNFILFHENKLYRLQTKKDNWTKIQKELERGEINEKFMGLPMSYIYYIEFREEDNDLRCFYGQDSEDTLKISDEKLRREIFDYIKSSNVGLRYDEEEPSIVSRIKKPLIALGVVSGIFLYVYSFIDGMNQGYEYEIVGGGRPGIGGIALGLAQLGLAKNVLLFGSFAGLAIFSISRNIKKNSLIHRLVFRKKD